MTRFFSKQTTKSFISVFCFLLFISSAFSQSEIPERQLTVPDFKGTAKEFIELLGHTENLVFAYSSEVSLDFQVSFMKKQMGLTELLDILLKGRPIGYKIKGNKVQLFPAKTSASEPITLTQVVRGSIVDADSKLPLPGTSVSVIGTEPLIGTSADANGYFRLENIPVGRINLQISFVGYETMTIQNIEVFSGKETVLDLNMKESAIKMDDVIVKSSRNKGDAINEMSLLSSRSISVEETKRFTGGMDDPARVVSSFAGVAATPDGSSDIIVRGNSPKYMKWRIDGIEITSPYHLDDQNASFGAITALNNSLLATSDFHTGAFSSEYGDVLTSVMDVKLRSGNNEKFEAACGIGIMGTDVTLEGPFKKGYGGSFLVNYRYSTATLLKDFGIIDVDGAVNYQDATFKIVLPTKKAGTFSIFALGGLSGFSMKNITAEGISTPGGIKNAAINKDYDKGAGLANIGINHTLSINRNSFVKTSLSFSANEIDDDLYEFSKLKKYNDQGEVIGDSVTEKIQTFNSIITNSAYHGAITYNNRINAKNKIQIGIRYTLWSFNYNQNAFNNQTETFQNVTDFNNNASSINSFISWKYNINEKIFIVSGLHYMNVLLNNKSTLEPRVAVNWRINSTNSVYAGFGKHSTMESMHNYFTKIMQSDGSFTEPNKNLDLLKANHYVLGYEKFFSENLRAKIELYYQYLYNLPVENNDTSYYATINEGFEYRYVPLVNKGVGKNYGIEFTLERFFDNNYYFLINASLFDSKYKSLEGTWRNTRYNSNYLVNILTGKEFKNLGSKHNKTLALNAKAFFCGGQRYIPLLRDAQGNVAVDPENDHYFDYKKAYNKTLGDLFDINLSISFKINRPRSTHEIFIDLMNIVTSNGKLGEYYDASKPSQVGYTKQMIFLPNIMYRVYF
jgi:hypothetical protein